MAPRNSSSSSIKPKRVRRKCTAPGCTNRVVQGGVCVTHGAKRKLCSYAGCSKAVKLAGFCSTHGPTRKKCDYVDPSSGDPCARVAVQGGRCLSHGARRRFCAFPGKEVCTKNAVHGGYCKKHHDLVQDASGMLVLQSSPSIKSDTGDSIKNNSFCMPVGASGGSVISGASSESVSDQSIASSSATTGILGGGMEQQEHPLSLECEQQVESRASSNEKPPSKKKSNGSKFPTPQHKRGLSIFDEMPTVDAIISMGEKQREPAADTAAAAAEGIASLASQQKELKQEPEQPYIPPQVPYADSNKTPNTQVTFADGTGQSQEAPVTAQPTSQENPEEICLRNPSCTCEACRSPTLAIFEQMLQASHKLERGEIVDDRYAGLSPPKLSPSKRSTSSKHTKSVKFPGGQSSSSNSVGRKVGANNFSVSSSSITLSQKQSHADGCSASTALAAAVKLARDVDTDEASHVRRAVSHDVESPRSRYYHHQYYGYPHSHNYHPSQYHHHNQYPHHHYYYHQPYPQHYYRHHESTQQPTVAPGTPILSDDPPRLTQSPSESRREKRKQQKRLLPKPRGKEMEHLFVPSEAK